MKLQKKVSIWKMLMQYAKDIVYLIVFKNPNSLYIKLTCVMHTCLHDTKREGAFFDMCRFGSGSVFLTLSLLCERVAYVCVFVPPNRLGFCVINIGPNMIRLFFFLVVLLLPCLLTESRQRNVPRIFALIFILSFPFINPFI